MRQRILRSCVVLSWVTLNAILFSLCVSLGYWYDLGNSVENPLGTEVFSTGFPEADLSRAHSFTVGVVCDPQRKKAKDN
jgi:hypothetical protein